MLGEGYLLSIGDVLTAVYWISAIVGGGLVLISTLGGGDSDTHADVDTHVDFDAHVDADVDIDTGVDAHADLDADVDAHDALDGATAHHADGPIADAGSVATWFSIRFLVFFLAAFGAVGVVLNHLSDVGGGATFGAALLAGLLIGQCIHQLMRLMRRTAGDGTPIRANYVNQRARVAIAIAHPNKGEIVLTVRGAQRYVPAVCKHEAGVFPVGAEVGVVDYRGGVAEVVSIEEFEFLRETEKGAES